MYNPIPGQTYKTDNFSIDLRTMKQPVITEDYIDLEFNGETIWKNEGCNLQQKAAAKITSVCWQLNFDNILVYFIHFL